MSFLSNSTHNTLLSQQGFVAVPFLSPPEVEALLVVYDEFYAKKAEYGFSASIVNSDPEMNWAMWEKIKPVCAPKVEQHFEGFRILHTILMVKKPGEGGILAPHMDWTFVDESRFQSFGIWIALSDTHRENGGISFLKGVHHCSQSPRGQGWEDETYDLSDHVNELAKTQTVGIDVKAGDAIVFNHRTIHFSGLNATNENRIALHVAVVPEEAETFHLYNHPDGQVFKYPGSRSFFFEYQHGKPPSQKYDKELFPLQKPRQLPLSLIRDRLGMPYYSPVLQNHVQDEHLRLDGFIKVPFLEPTLLQQLNSLFQEVYASQVHSDFASNFTENNAELNRTVLEAFRPLLTSVVEQWMPGYQLLFGAFMVKRPSTGGQVIPHLDWAFVDETTHRSFSIWIALQDIDRQNGGLNFIQSTHQHAQNLRGQGWPQPAYNLQERLPELLKERSQPVDLKAGEAIIYDHRTLHFSDANHSDQVRVGINLSVVPKGTQHFHFNRLADGRVEKFHIDSEFMIQYQHGSPPPRAYLAAIIEPSESKSLV